MTDQSPIQRPKNLTRSGVIAWNKLTEIQKKHFPENHLGSSHFRSHDDYGKFVKERRVAPFRERLLEGVNTSHLPVNDKLFDNLSEILADFNDKLNELDKGKQDKPYDW
jgi:hypothetical protein